jgi:hypothetical protein
MRHILLEAGSEAGISPYFSDEPHSFRRWGAKANPCFRAERFPDMKRYYNFYNIGSTPDPDVENSPDQRSEICHVGK